MSMTARTSVSRPGSQGALRGRALVRLQNALRVEAVLLGEKWCAVPLGPCAAEGCNRDDRYMWIHLSSGHTSTTWCLARVVQINTYGSDAFWRFAARMGHLVPKEKS